MAQRARIVLLAAEDRSNRDIGELVGMHYNQVAVWRRRYRLLGLAGLADDPRPGRPPVYGHDIGDLEAALIEVARTYGARAVITYDAGGTAVRVPGRLHDRRHQRGTSTDATAERLG